MEFSKQHQTNVLIMLSTMEVASVIKTFSYSTTWHHYIFRYMINLKTHKILDADTTEGLHNIPYFRDTH